MPIVEWSDSFLIGIQRVDQHNQHLLELFSRLYKRSIEQFEINNIQFELIDLLDYVVYHFACEEIWMAHTKYSFISDHHKEHEQLNQKLVDIQIDFQRGNIYALRMLPSLVKSVITHIEKCDATYAHSVL